MATHPKSKRYNKDWRKKTANSALLKYSKDIILDRFSTSILPENIKFPKELYTECMPPVFFSAEKPECENSRKNARSEKKERSDFKSPVRDLKI